MKRILLSCLVTLFSVAMWGAGVEIDGLQYTFNSSNFTCSVTYPGSSQYAQSTYAGDIVIPETVEYENDTYTVTAIGQYSFSGAYDLTSLVIPATVTSLGAYSLYDCIGVNSITVYNSTPPSVTSSNAFVGINESCVLYVPTQSVNVYKEDGKWGYAFANIEGFGYTFSAVTLDATDVLNTSATLNGVISANGANVVEQGFKYWANENDIKTVEVEGVEVSANITDLYPGTKYTFYAYMEVEDGIIVCGDEKTFTTKGYDLSIDGFFYNIISENTVEVTCENDGNTPSYNVETITIPETVTIDNTTYTVIGTGYDCFYNCSNIVHVNLPSTLTYIGEGTFQNCNLIEELTIPENVSSIGGYTFYGCTSLKNLTIPENVTSIGARTFYKCTSLTEVSIPDKLTTIGDHAFSECSALKALNLPESLTTIEQYAFSDCELLEELYISRNVKEIGIWAFTRCRLLEKIILNDGLVSIGSSAFFGCYALNDITIPSTVTSLGYGAFEFCRGLEEITIPESITSIENYTFFGCETLKTVHLPSTITSIDYYAFADCYALEQIELPSGLTFLGNTSFRNCSSLKEITIPQGVSGLYYDSFYQCTNLEKVILPEGLEAIGSQSFYGCLRLTDISIPESVKSIGYYAFYSCVSLPSITIPEGITTISEGTFGYCSALTEVTIPESVTSIVANAFRMCESLAKVYSLNTTPPTCGDDVFTDIAEGCVLYVPVGSYSEYSNADTWQDFFSIIEMTPTTVETYEASDITYCSALLKGNVEEGYQEIVEKGFEYWAEDDGTTKVVVDDDEMVAIVSDLKSETTYTYRAYATTESGTEYGEEKTFTTIEIPDGISSVSIDDIYGENVEGYYSTSGQMYNTPQRGVNIVRMSDGTTKKILIK